MKHEINTQFDLNIRFKIHVFSPSLIGITGSEARTCLTHFPRVHGASAWAPSQNIYTSGGRRRLSLPLLHVIQSARARPPSFVARENSPKRRPLECIVKLFLLWRSKPNELTGLAIISDCIEFTCPSIYNIKV